MTDQTHPPLTTFERGLAWVLAYVFSALLVVGIFAGTNAILDWIFS